MLFIQIAMRQSFGQQLRKERKKQGLTTEVIAKASGVSRSYITLIENGKRLPGRKKMVKRGWSLLSQNIQT